MLVTTGVNFYPGLQLHMTVTDGLAALKDVQAHEYCKIIYIKTGASHFVLNGTEFVLTGACAICMNAQDNISFYNVNEEEVKLLWFKPTVVNLKLTNEVLKNPARVLAQAEWMDFYFLMQFAGEAKATTKILSLHTIDSAGLENKIQQIRDLLTKQDKNTWPCRSRSYLFEILFCLARQEDDESPSEAVVLYEGSSRLAIDVIYYLQSRYNEKITIDRLAETFHTNRTTLISDFKKYTGQPVNQYLIDLRLTMAAALLRDTELSADEISERTGFGDISYFSRVFKKKLFYTPSEYRRMNKHKIY